MPDRELVGHLVPSKPYNNFLIELKVWFIRFLFEKCKDLEDNEKIFAGLSFREHISKSMKSFPMLKVSITIPKSKPPIRKDLFSFQVSDQIEQECKK